jgi:hypothetical protein
MIRPQINSSVYAQGTFGSLQPIGHPGFEYKENGT